MSNQRIVAQRQFTRLAENYRYINGMDLDEQPARLAMQGYKLREKMGRGIRRIGAAAKVTDDMQPQTEGMGLAFLPVLAWTAGASGLTWLATKLGDDSDAYIARTEVVKGMIEQGVSPDDAANIVLGRDKMSPWKAGGIGLGIGVLTVVVWQWRSGRKRRA